MGRYNQAGHILDVVLHCMRAVRAEMRLQASDDLSVPQFRALARLSRGEATNKDVADWLGVSTPTITRMVDGLVARQLVERAASPGDRREIRLRLTAKGRAKFEKIRGSVRDKIAERVARIPGARQKQLKQGLDILRELFP